MDVQLSSIYFFYVLVLYCMFCFLLFSGRVFARYFLKPLPQNNIYLKGFIHIFTGIVLLVFTYSVFCTHFKTINLSFIILFLFAFIELKKHNLTGNLSFSTFKFFPKVRSKENRELLIFLLLFPALLCLWQLISMSHGNNIPFMSTEMVDNIYFGKVSGYLALTGEENTFLSGSLFCESLKGGTPYHYFELWMNAFVAKSFGLNTVYSLILVTRPLFLLLLSLGMLAITQSFLLREKSVIVSVLLKAFTLLFLFFSEINWHPLLKNNYSGFTIEPAVGIMWVNYQKTIIVRVLVVLFGLCAINKKYGLGIVALLFLPVVYSTVTVVLLSGLLLSLSFMLIFKIISGKDFLRYIMYTLLVSFFCFMYYRLFGNEIFMESMSRAMSTYSAYFSNREYLADAFYLFKIIPLATSAGFLSWIILLILGKEKKGSRSDYNETVKLIFLFACTFFITGLVAWCMLRFLTGVNSSQLFYTLFIPFAFILFLILFISFTRRKILTITFLLLTTVILISCNYVQTKNGYHSEQSPSYSQQYIDSTFSLYKQHSESPIVFLRDSGFYMESSSNKSSLTMPLKHLAFLSGKENLVSIDVFNVPPESISTQQNQTLLYLITSVFYQYCEKQKQEGRFISLEKSQLDFIKEYHVKYLAAAPNSIISAELQTHFDRIIEDKNTGERFITLESQ
jgi:hypothetical protein